MRGGWCPREAPAAARGARDRGGVARRGDGRDGRLRARDRVRAGGGAGRPPPRHRALRRGVARDRRRARAGAAQRGRALVSLGAAQHVHPGARRGDGEGDARLPARRPARLRGRRGTRPAGAGRGARGARAGDRLGARGRRQADGGRPLPRCGSWASRSSPRTWPSRSRSRRACTRCRSTTTGRRTWRSCGSRTRTAPTSRSRRRARPRSASGTSPSSRARASRCCSGRPPGS